MQAVFIISQLIPTVSFRSVVIRFVHPSRFNQPWQKTIYKINMLKKFECEGHKDKNPLS